MSVSKAAAVLARGAYREYASTTKRRERRWRTFSTLPLRVDRKESDRRAKLEEALFQDSNGAIWNGSHSPA